MGQESCSTPSPSCPTADVNPVDDVQQLLPLALAAQGQQITATFPPQCWSPDQPQQEAGVGSPQPFLSLCDCSQDAIESSSWAASDGLGLGGSSRVHVTPKQHNWGTSWERYSGISKIQHPYPCSCYMPAQLVPSSPEAAPTVRVQHPHAAHADPRLP